MGVCVEPGCPELVTVGRCPAHQRAHQNAQRSTSIRRDYGPDWERISRRIRRQRPACECTDPACGVCAGHCTNTSEHVDHITPLEYFTDLRAAHDPSNLQALCRRCHASKSARLDVRFGQAQR